MAGTLTPSGIAFTLSAPSGRSGSIGTLYRASSGLDGSYATVEELFLYSLAETTQHDFQYPGDALLHVQLRRASREADSMICHRFKTPL